jgi:hypothetical protein
MRKQTDSKILAARDDGKQHGVPPKRIDGYSTNRAAALVAVSLWKNVHRFWGQQLAVSKLPSPLGA